MISAPVLCALCALASAPGVRDDDGVYGRLDADWTLVVGAGGSIAAGRDRRFLSTELRARYLESAGVVLSYDEADAFSKNSAPGTFRRGFLAGVEIRPLFPARFLQGIELNRRFVDLVLDSVGFELGAYFSAVRGADVQSPGLSLGFGIEVPLAGSVSGPWLRLATAVRWPSTVLENDDRSARMTLFTLGLAWHQAVELHTADAGDRHVR